MGFVSKDTAKPAIKASSSSSAKSAAQSSGKSIPKAKAVEVKKPTASQRSAPKKGTSHKEDEDEMLEESHHGSKHSSADVDHTKLSLGSKQSAHISTGAHSAKSKASKAE